jgi:hypothetical protein
MVIIVAVYISLVLLNMVGIAAIIGDLSHRTATYFAVHSSILTRGQGGFRLILLGILWKLFQNKQNIKLLALSVVKLCSSMM